MIRLPADVHRRAVGILDRISRHGTGCVHIERTGVGVVCLMHPSTVRCVACTAAHITTHTRAEEHSCDGCGGSLETSDFLAVAHPVEVDTTVSIGRGRRAAIGVVHLVGYGVCEACWPGAVVVAA